MLKLNLGCGQNLLAGYVNVDKFATHSPDVVWDLEETPWPFETGSVDEIVMHHVLEHLGAQTNVFLAIMQELYRVCAPNALLSVAVPHPRSDAYSNDPTHVRPITESLLCLFSKKRNQEAKELGWANTPMADYLDIDFDLVSVAYDLTPRWAQKYHSGELSKDDLEYARDTYFNVINEIKMELRAIKQPMP